MSMGKEGLWNGFNWQWRMVDCFKQQ